MSMQRLREVESIAGRTDVPGDAALDPEVAARVYMQTQRELRAAYTAETTRARIYDHVEPEMAQKHRDQAARLQRAMTALDAALASDDRAVQAAYNRLRQSPESASERR